MPIARVLLVDSRGEAGIAWNAWVSCNLLLALTPQFGLDSSGGGGGVLGRVVGRGAVAAMSGANARGRLSPASGGGGDSEPRSAGSRTRSVSATRGRKPSPRPGRDAAAAAAEEKKPAAVPTLLPSLSVPAGMRRQELLLRSGLSLDASCSSDASTDSFCSRASTGRIGRPTFGARKKKTLCQTDHKIVSMLEREVGLASANDVPGLKRRCSWVTANTGACSRFACIFQPVST